MITLKLAKKLSTPLQAPKILLIAASAVAVDALGLADDGGEWDLSNLQVDGQPVGRETVTTWLSAASKLWNDVELEENSDTSLAGLCRVLAFADAVDTRAGLMRALCCDLDKLQLSFQVGEQSFSVQLDAAPLYIDSNGRLAHTHLAGPVSRAHARVFTADERVQLTAQLVEQLEAAMYMAYKLRLTPLINRLHAFVSAAGVFPGEGLLRDEAKVCQVFSARVLGAMTMTQAPFSEAWVHSALQQNLSFRPAHPACALRVVAPSGQSGSVTFEVDAVLTRDVLGSKAGDKVKLKFDFSKGMLETNGGKYPLTLALSPPFAGTDGTMLGGASTKR